MFFGFVRGNNAQGKRLSEMLMQLKGISRTKGNSSEYSRLIQEIDDAIAHMAQPALEDALKASNWSKRDIVDFLKFLQSSRDEISRTSHKSDADNMEQYPVNFSKTDGSIQQSKMIIKTVSESLSDPQPQAHQRLIQYIGNGWENISQPGEVIGTLETQRHKAIVKGASNNFVSNLDVTINSLKAKNSESF